MGILLALSLLAAPGDVLIRLEQPVFTLSGAERTALGSAVAAQWPAAVLSSVVGFHAEKTKLSSAICAPYYSEALTASSLFTLLQTAGASAAPGLAATEQRKWLVPSNCAGGLATAIVNITTARQANATAARLRAFDCVRVDASTINCSFDWVEPFAQAALFAMYQTATSVLISDGVE